MVAVSWLGVSLVLLGFSGLLVAVRLLDQGESDSATHRSAVLEPTAQVPIAVLRVVGQPTVRTPVPSAPRWVVFARDPESVGSVAPGDVVVPILSGAAPAGMSARALSRHSIALSHDASSGAVRAETLGSCEVWVGHSTVQGPFALGPGEAVRVGGRREPWPTIDIEWPQPMCLDPEETMLIASPSRGDRPLAETGELHPRTAVRGVHEQPDRFDALLEVIDGSGSWCRTKVVPRDAHGIGLFGEGRALVPMRTGGAVVGRVYYRLSETPPRLVLEDVAGARVFDLRVGQPARNGMTLTDGARLTHRDDEQRHVIVVRFEPSDP